MIRLETQRLVLRDLCSGDAEVIHDYRNDDRCARYQRGQTKDFPGICSLVEGMAVTDVIAKTEGICCGMKTTSCPDQLATALKQAIEQK